MAGLSGIVRVLAVEKRQKTAIAVWSGQKVAFVETV